MPNATVWADLIPEAPADEPTIGRDTMCERLGITDNTLRARISKGLIRPPFFNEERHHRWFWSEVRADLVRSRKLVQAQASPRKRGRPPKRRQEPEVVAAPEAAES
jgi:hypothetical protein